MSNLTIEERFWIKVNKNGPIPEHQPWLGPCWLWTACVNREGYGNFLMDGKSELSHRVAYRLTFEDFDRELCVLHRCDNPPCVRPSHLFRGTQIDNIADSKTKHRLGRLHGSMNPGAKLNEMQVLEIRKLHKDGLRSRKKLAEMFCVSIPLIDKILQRTAWAHI